MKRLFRILLVLGVLLLVGILSIVLFNTFNYSSRQIKVEAIPKTAVSEKAAERLGDAVRIPTVSREGFIDTAAFLRLDTFLARSFPRVDSMLVHKRINRFSHVYKWSGQKSGLEPILLTGHLDVVPAEGDQLARWTKDPFSGLVEGGFIWGRGTLDDKGACLGILEAIEQLLDEDYVPERTIYLAFGHDEEVRGARGAQQIARYFESEGLRFAYVMDEGMVILDNALPGLDSPFAGVGVAEKGYATLELTVRLEEGGHSSMPPKETAIGILSRAIYRLQQNPLPARMEGIVSSMLDHLGPEMAFPMKAAFANRWLTGGLLQGQLSRQPSGNAMIRTTAAPTILKSGFKENVLPLSATAKVNFRIVPGETVESTIQQVKAVVADERISVQPVEAGTDVNPSPVSDPNGFGFHTIQKTIREIYPEAVVAPALVIAATDARYYVNVSDQVFRFFPVRIDNEDLKRIHGIDERISVEAYQDVIRFYRQLIKNSAR